MPDNRQRGAFTYSYTTGEPLSMVGFPFTAINQNIDQSANEPTERMSLFKARPKLKPEGSVTVSGGTTISEASLRRIRDDLPF